MISYHWECNFAVSLMMLLVVKMSSADGGRDVRDVASSIRRHLNDKIENGICSQVLLWDPWCSCSKQAKLAPEPKNSKRALVG